jgi:hypothetical protein
VILIPLTLLAGLGLGLVRGGRLSNVAAAPLRHGEAVVLALLLQVLAGLPAPGTGGARALLLASYVCIAAFAWVNRTVPGVALVCAGCALNALVVALNGAMPVSGEALAAVDPGSSVQVGALHRPLREGDALPWLADVIPVPLLRTVVSAGDVVLAAGVAVLVERLTRLPRRGAARDPALTPPGATARRRRAHRAGRSQASTPAPREHA